MQRSSLKSTIIVVALASIIFAYFPVVNSADISQSREAFEIERKSDIYSSRSLVDDKSGKTNEKLNTLQVQARVYRNQGLEQQRAGNNLEAMSLYLKAIQLDPFYAVAYNDLGVIYESQGELDKAQDCYLKSTHIDPGYLSPYSNLASLYEAKRDLKSAAYYWKKRVQMGTADDIWTQKARRRLDDLRLVLRGQETNPSEENILDLAKYVAVKKSIMRYDDHALARNYFDKARLYYKKADYPSALKFAIDAQLLDPENKEIEDFVERLQTRLLSK